jgi:peptidoglycan/LPS O-acetylase OafA/YrhL
MARPAGQKASTEIGGIQVLRGAAALSVAFLHIEQAAGAFVGRPGQSPWPWLRALPWEAGVDVFFVISGFVMAYSSARLFGQPGAMRSFLARRVSRVVPLYWLFTTLTLAVALAAPRLLNDPISGGWQGVVASYLFIPWPRQDGAMQPLFRLGWTLNYEMLFYLLFAPFLWWGPRAGAGGVILAIGALAAAGQLLRPVNPQLGFWTDPIVIEFGYGVALGCVRTERVRIPRAWRLLLLGLGVAAFAVIGVDDTQRRALSYGLPSACLVAGAAFGPGWSGRSALSRAALGLGDASYALYLVHPYPMRGLREVWSRIGFGGNGGIASYILASLALSCALAIWLHRRLELPLVRAARKALDAPRLA